MPNRTGRIAKAIPDINTNLKTTAAEKNIKDSQDKKAAAVSLLKNKITELFGDSEILSNDFYDALLNNSKLYPEDYTEYLDWAYNKVKASSPDDIAKYFYKVASKTYYVTNFYAAKLSESKNLQQENKKNTGMYTCPVCGKSHLYSDDCPECGLKFDDRQPENIEMQKIKYKYGPEVYDRLTKELESEKNKIMPEFSFTKNSVWIKKQKEIIAKYI